MLFEVETRKYNGNEYQVVVAVVRVADEELRIDLKFASKTEQALFIMGLKNINK